MAEFNRPPRWKVILTGTLLCGITGAVLSLLYGLFPRQVLYAGIGGLLVILLGFIRRGRLTVTDWFLIFLMVIPLHSIRVGSPTVFLRLTEIVFLPLSVWWIIAYKKSSEQQKLHTVRREYLILLFFFLFSFISSLLSSASPVVSVYRTLLLLYLVFVSFMFSKILPDIQRVFYFVKAMMLISAVTGGIALLQSFFPVLIPFPSWPFATIGGVSIVRAGVGWENPGYYGLYLIGIIPVTVSCLLSGRFEPHRRFLQWCLFFQLLGLISSYSRGSFIAFFCAALFLLWVYGKRMTALILVFLSLFSAVLLTIGVDYIYKTNPYLSAYVFRIGDIRNLKKDPTLILGYRVEAWTVYSRMFLSHPLLGLGPFMSRVHYRNYLGNDLPDRGWPTAPHSEYLSLLSERGIIGFTLFLSFVAAVLISCFRGVRRCPQTRESDLLIGLAASIIGFLVFSIAGASIYDIHFWLNVGIVMALTDNVSGRRPVPECNRPACGIISG